MKYLIVGTGGTGGCIGGLLALDSRDVSFISRGKNLEHMKQHGLRLKTGVKGELYLPSIKVFSDAEYKGKADVIFICVKSYSIDEVIPVIKSAAHENSIIIPILNGYGMGEKIARKSGTAHVLDGCIYISSFVNSPGSVTQMGQGIKIVFGPIGGDSVSPDLLSRIKSDLDHCGIHAVITDHIQSETFKKFAFISSYAACGAYYDIPAKELQQEGQFRNTFIELCEEIKAVGNKLGVEPDLDVTKANIRILDSLTPETTASMQKDLKAGRQSEMDGLVFEVVRLAESFGAEVPSYRMIAEHFGYQRERD